jgi:hypothetical protein
LAVFLEIIARSQEKPMRIYRLLLPESRGDLWKLKKIDSHSQPFSEPADRGHDLPYRLARLLGREKRVNTFAGFSGGISVRVSVISVQTTPGSKKSHGSEVNDGFFRLSGFQWKLTDRKVVFRCLIQDYY